VTRRVRALGIRDKHIAAVSQWQNGFAERLIGSIRRECADHNYNESRVHRALGKDAPFHRVVERLGGITSAPVLGGLHHQYCRI
jgi:transposase InsO family protein